MKTRKPIVIKHMVVQYGSFRGPYDTVLLQCHCRNVFIFTISFNDLKSKVLSDEEKAKCVMSFTETLIL